MGAPDFGASGVNSRTRAHSVDRVEHVDGLDKNLYIRSEQGTITERNDICGSWGIEAEATNQFGRSLRSVTLTETEEVVTHEIWSGATPAQTGITDKLVGVDCIVKTRLEQRISIQGIGSLPTGYRNTNLGSLKDISVQTAIGATIVACDDMFFESLSDDANMTDFTGFNLEFTKFTPTTDPTGQANLISLSLPADVQATFYKISRTTTLSAEGFATTEVSIEEIYKYDETASDFS